MRVSVEAYVKMKQALESAESVLYAIHREDEMLLERAEWESRTIFETKDGLRATKPFRVFGLHRGDRIHFPFSPRVDADTFSPEKLAEPITTPIERRTYEFQGFIGRPGNRTAYFKEV